MIKIGLDGEWKLMYMPQATKEVYAARNFGVNEWIPATVPGNVELDLFRAGQIKDPYAAGNVLELAPYEAYEWWYQKEFYVPLESEEMEWELHFHGVDCFATYWLNEVCIGHSKNMFIEHIFHVKDVLRYGETNKLTIRLRSPLIEAMNYPFDPSAAGWPVDWDRLSIRKAQHSFGWDIMPRSLSAGIWRSVELVARDANEFTDLYFQTDIIRGTSAELRLFYRLKLDAPDFSDLSIRINGQCGQSHFTYHSKIMFSTGSIVIPVADAQLWWPRGYGDASIYEITVEVIRNNQVLMAKNTHTGIRKVELIRSNVTTETDGQFLFRVNDVPILCKGSNWVPADMYHSRDKVRIPRILEMLSELECNIVRCWGGNVYEDHEFYDYCDRFGIMVWQDFGMACGPYPQDEQFLETIREEARAIVRKLRCHPSIVLWCGDNECDFFYKEPWKNRLTREVLPQVITQCDPGRPYLPSSPYFSEEYVNNREKVSLPEDHLWGPRDYYKSQFYQQSKAHFISEIGYHGCPNVSSIHKFIDTEHLWPWEHNDQWNLHSTDMKNNSFRVELMANQIYEMFGIHPTTLEEFAIASQISQAEAKKYFIERTRLNKWKHTGIIWWNLMDGWPQFSDAVVDYYYEKKLAYHYIRRVQQPFCIMAAEPSDWKVQIVAGNDSLQFYSGTYRVTDADSGETLVAGDFHVQPNENQMLGAIKVSRSDQRLLLLHWELGGGSYGNHYLLGTPAFSLNQYKGWLSKISQIDGSFDADTVGL